MIKYENECVGCKDIGVPCQGSCCPNRHVKRLYCDECGDKSDKLYIFSDMELCKDCLLGLFDVVKEN